MYRYSPILRAILDPILLHTLHVLKGFPYKKRKKTKKTNKKKKQYIVTKQKTNKNKFTFSALLMAVPLFLIDIFQSTLLPTGLYAAVVYMLNVQHMLPLPFRFKDLFSYVFHISLQLPVHYI